jgi:hypothetical protein
MKLKRDKLDTLKCILESQAVMNRCFLSIKDEDCPLDKVENYRKCVEEALKELDKRMCTVMTEQSDRIIWARRMKTCIGMMRVITMNLAFWGKPEWNWEEVAEAMAFLEAVKESAELTLKMNEPE